MKILIGVLMGMLLGGGAVWAFHDSRPDTNIYEMPVTPFDFRSDNAQRREELTRSSPFANPCRH
jgi:hypothetical protein